MALPEKLIGRDVALSQRCPFTTSKSTSNGLSAGTKVRLLASVVVVALAVGPTIARGQSVPALSTPEESAFHHVKSTTNPAAKLAAAEDFIAKFPRSSKRVEVAAMVADHLKTLRNPAVAVTMIDRAFKLFSGPEELAHLKPVALQVFADVGRADEAFALAPELLARKPDQLSILIRLTFLGATEAQKRNLKHAETSIQYGMRAIEVVETDIKPADTSPEVWTVQKAALPNLYQQLGILTLAQGKNGEARTFLTRATQLGPKDPSSFALLGRLANNEYEKALTVFESMPEGQAKQDEKKKLDELMDEIIDMYARAAGLATGKVEHQTLLQQVIPDLTNYYKHRNNQSTAGLKQLINKYRAQQYVIQ